jgi:hypothetical protein
MNAWKAVMRPVVSLLAGLVVFTSCSSGDRTKNVYYVPFPEGAVNEFRYLGNWLVCNTEDHFDGYDGCLHIGDIWIGQSLPEVEGKLGQPHRIISDDPQNEVRIHLLQGGSDEDLPYLVLTVSEGKVSAIQVTGVATESPYTFSSLALGDTAEKVEEILGKPGLISPIEEIEGTMWSYRPFPISLELKDGRVFSIKISRPTGSTAPPSTLPYS